MKSETRKAKLAKLLDIPMPDISKPEQENRSREAEAVLAYASGMGGFIRRQCKECNRMFAHTRASIAYCSDTCRAAGLERIGIKWNWLKPANERWGKFEPLVVPPEALAILDELDSNKVQVIDLSESDSGPETGIPGTPDRVPSVLPPSVLDLLHNLGID